ncbi:MAG: class II fructose-bisphosphate aldolase [Candidatus Wildermuthbacteria bacterium]|nr:class II fructose-bisphosphate aldolase [Candidatus Wildermuthbacteria bacterium]
MQTFKQILQAKERAVALGHFNISELSALKAIVGAAQHLEVPVIVGVSEGERKFIGVQTVVALVRSLREELNHPLFLNADHSHSFEAAKEAIDAGFDAVIFDGAKFPLEENIKQTRAVVEYAKSRSVDVVIEGEVGYIGASSEVFQELPEGAAVEAKDLTTPEQARQFVEETGVDLFAPAIGNIHGMLKAGSNPPIDIERIKTIQNAVSVPLVLHGGSGIPDGDIQKAVHAGISIVHISTELRKAWRDALEDSLRENPDEVAPYKLLMPGVAEMQAFVERKLRLLTS